MFNCNRRHMRLYDNWRGYPALELENGELEKLRRELTDIERILADNYMPLTEDDILYHLLRELNR